MGLTEFDEYRTCTWGRRHSYRVLACSYANIQKHRRKNVKKKKRKNSIHHRTPSHQTHTHKNQKALKKSQFTNQHKTPPKTSYLSNRTEKC